MMAKKNKRLVTVSAEQIPFSVVSGRTSFGALGADKLNPC